MSMFIKTIEEENEPWTDWSFIKQPIPPGAPLFESPNPIPEIPLSVEDEAVAKGLLRALLFS